MRWCITNHCCWLGDMRPKIYCPSIRSSFIIWCRNIYFSWIIIIWWKDSKIHNISIVWIKFCYYQGKSHFYILKNNAVSPVPTGGHHWVEFLPNHVYCFTPSMERNKGEPLMCTAMPEFLKEFLFSVEIKQVKVIKIWVYFDYKI